MRTIGVAVLLLGCASCENPRSWSYTPEAPRARQPLMDVSVSVPPAIDQRPDENDQSIDMCLIPLMPYGWMDLSRPEAVHQHMTSRQWQFRPDEDLAKAVAIELQSAGLFKEVFFTQRSSEGDLTLQLTLRSLRYDSTVLTYGLSAFGTLLWFVLPTGTANSALGLEFELKDHTGNSLWSGQSERSYESGAYWIYSPPSDFQYDIMLKDMLLKDVLPALEQLPAQR